MTDTPKTSSLRKRMVYVLPIAVLALLATVAAQIDDWSRDLTTNFAETSVAAEDPLDRPLAVVAEVEEIEQAIRTFVENQPRWELKGSDSLPSIRSIFLTRKTKWLKFTDDVQVDIHYSQEPILVEISSQSRVGKGDLGQNPRNIRELNRALREQLDVAK
ncbi:MAG: DUF1499 domain-containing protein [Lacipirellulaceae bacterium]